jgi:hypothetical protein
MTNNIKTNIMKKTLTVFAIAALFAACKSNTNTSEQQKSNLLGVADTAGLHEFQMYKEQQAREKDTYMETQALNDANNITENTSAAPAVKERIVYVDRPAPRKTSSSRTRSTSTKRSSGGYSGGRSSSGSGTVAQAPARKKGWSKAAKGTAIGAGSGAVLGAIVSKKKGKGAIIGGIIGAAGGYAIGRGQDKKDGRY